MYSQGLTEGLNLTILFQRGLKETTEHPSPAAWMEIQQQLASVRLVSTGKPWITASTATTVFMNIAVIRGYQST